MEAINIVAERSRILSAGELHRVTVDDGEPAPAPRGSMEPCPKCGGAAQWRPIRGAADTDPGRGRRPWAQTTWGWSWHDAGRSCGVEWLR